MFLLVSLFFLVLTITPVCFADNETDVDITLFPQQLSERWNISPFAAGVFLSVCVVFAFLLPLSLLKLKGIAYLIIGLCILPFCIAIGWMSYWVMILLVLLIAVLYASRIRRSL